MKTAMQLNIFGFQGSEAQRLVSVHLFVYFHLQKAAAILEQS